MTSASYPENVEYLIIGAGPTGLGAGVRLKELNKNQFFILEGSKDVGGLARSVIDEQGFTWDIGGHIQFSHYDYFDKVMSKALGQEGFFHHQRESWVWMKDRFIPYPFQNHLRYLPKDDQWRCLEGLLELRAGTEEKPIAHFREWLQKTFGTGITDIFLEPYNFKVWAHPLDQMSYQWVGERVAVVDLKTTLRNIFFQEDSLSWGPNNTFAFPKHGGTGAIWKAVATMVGTDHIALDSPVNEVNAQKKYVVLKNGTKIGYRFLLNTMPLTNLVTCLGTDGEPLKQYTNDLLFSSSNIFGIGIEGQPPESLKTKCWMYFPEPHVPFYRVTVFSNYSPNNTPHPGHTWSLMAEVSESKYKTVDSSIIMDSVIDGLIAAKLLNQKEKILSRWFYRTPNGYPIPSKGRDRALHAIHDVLEPLDIYSRGRFGGWKYEVSNQDHSLMQGVEWVNRVVNGAAETTYPPIKFPS